MISVDPGKRVLGVARWTQGVLTRAHLVRLKGRSLNTLLSTLPERSQSPHSLGVCEYMRWRPNDARSQPNTLIDVATVGAVYTAQNALQVKLVTPLEWKGAVPKSVSHRRIFEKLMGIECGVLESAMKGCPPGHHKEILDAIGIGLWELKR